MLPREHVQEDYQTYNIPMMETKSDMSNRELEVRLLLGKVARGVFYSYTYYGVLRVYITLDADTNVYNSVLSALLQSSIEKSDCAMGLLYIRKKTPKATAFLEENFHITPSDKLFFYESKKFAITREQFNAEYDNSVLELRPYDDSYLDELLRLFDEAYIFCMPPTFHMDQREQQLEELRHCRDNFTLETFWKDDELVGYYNNVENEVDGIAVFPKFQGKGYGTIILTRAISRIFENTDSNIAWLIAASFNEKACSFYRKNGMEVHGEYRLARLDD